MNICIVIPTYNEVENIPVLIERIFACCPRPGLEICVVDDSSPDGTADAVAKLDRPDVCVIRRAIDRGYGKSVNQGIAHALAQGAQRIITMDADFSHRPEILPNLIDEMHDADLVIGSRYRGEKAAVENTPLSRRLASRFASAYVRTMARVDVRDTTSGYRCWRAEFLRKMPLSRIRSTGYAYLYETLFYAGMLGAKIREIENIHVERTRGESKMNAKIVLEGMWIPLRLRLSRAATRQRRAIAADAPLPH